MDEDRARWDARYAVRRDGAAAWSHQPRAAAPDALALLNEVTLARLPATGLALDIACGTGAQSLWLAQRGMDVIAIDVSPVAIELVSAASRAHGFADRIDAHVHDLDTGLPPTATDVSMIVCQRFRGRDLYPQIVGALRPGGVAIITVLSAVGLDGTPGEFHAPPGELDAAFANAGVDVLASSETDGVASIIIQRR